MFDTASFHIIGRIGSIKTFTNLTRISIAANASYKKDGQWVEKTNWNEVVIFDKTTRAYVEEKFAKGDYIRTEGTLRQNSYERNGDKVYTTELIVDQISRLPVKRAEADQPENQREAA